MKELFVPSLVGSKDFSGQNVEFIKRPRCTAIIALMLFKENHLKEWSGEGGWGGYQLSHPLPWYAAGLRKQNDLMEKAITQSMTKVYFI